MKETNQQPKTRPPWRSRLAKSAKNSAIAVLNGADSLLRLFQTELVRQVGPGMKPEPFNPRDKFQRVAPWTH